MIQKILILLGVSILVVLGHISIKQRDSCMLELETLKRTQHQLEDFRRDLSFLDDSTLGKDLLLNSTTKEKDF